MLIGNPKVKAMTDAKRLTYQVSPDHLRITEMFFSLEGEGVLIGAPTFLIRCASCNQRCRFCDTKFSSWWDTDAFEVSRTTILETVAQYSYAEWVSFTGGEPLYRADGELETICLLAHDLIAVGRRLKVETSGTILPPPGFPYADVFWSIAPKLPGGGMGGGTFLDPELLQTLLTEYVWPDRGHIKFVIGAREKDNTMEVDFAGIRSLAQRVPALRQFPIIYQPEGLTESSIEYLTRCTLLAEAVLKDTDLMRLFPRWRVLPQWHQLLWRNERRR